MLLKFSSHDFLVNRHENLLKVSYYVVGIYTMQSLNL